MGQQYASIGLDCFFVSTTLQMICRAAEEPSQLFFGSSGSSCPGPSTTATTSWRGAKMGVKITKQIAGPLEAAGSAAAPVQFPGIWFYFIWSYLILYISYSICLSVCLSVFLSVCLSVCPSICLCIRLYHICLSACLSTYLSTGIPTCPHINLCLWLVFPSQLAKRWDSQPSASTSTDSAAGWTGTTGLNCSEKCGISVWKWSFKLYKLGLRINLTGFNGIQWDNGIHYLLNTQQYDKWM